MNCVPAIMTKLQIFTTTVNLLIILSHVSADCEINPFDANAPIIIGTSNNSIIYPNYGEKIIRFQANEVIKFACPETQLIINGKVSQSSVEATCISNARFRILGERFLWRQVVCSADPVPIGRYLNSNCGANARLAEIGFNLDDNRFVRTITVCFDTINQSPLYSYYDLPSSIASRDTTTPRPLFSQDIGFYNVGSNTVNQLFLRSRQRKTINGLLGLASNSTKYIDNGQLFFLSRGHLTARSDFIYGTQQNSTFRYINAAPQWQSFNGNNWNQAELDVRNYANGRNVELQVWTGTHGVTTLPHETTLNDVPLYLYVNGNTRALPVPAIFWKIIYNPATRRAVVLIGLNNPYETNVSKYVLCPDVSGQINWLTWKKDNIRSGYSYACTFGNFRKIVTFVPNLSVSGLLV